MSRLSHFPHPWRWLRGQISKRLLAPFYKRLSPSQRNSVRIIVSVIQILAIALVVMLIVYALVQSVLGASIFAPRTGGGVVSSVSTPANETVETQIIRQKLLYGANVRQDIVRQTTFDFNLKRYSSTAQGYYPQETIAVESDHGQMYYRLGGAPFQKAKFTIPFSAALPPLGHDLGTMDPQIISTQGSVVGARTWIISFKPTAALLRRILWSDPLHLVGGDNQALLANKFQTIYARAWISRSKRQLLMVDIQWLVNGAHYRALLTYSAIGHSSLR